MNGKRTSKADGKGNVLVSVRVRPDAGGHEPSPEWMVDGRKSLIAYRGKEGGDYVYGTSFERKQRPPLTPNH